MDLNATLLGQMLTFALFVWFTMKYVWPPITKAMEDRQHKIAAGLAAAERGVHDLELAQRKAGDYIHTAKVQAAELLEQANKRADQIVDEAKQHAKIEGSRILDMAQVEIERALQTAREQLRQQVASLALAGAERLIERNLDAKANSDLLDKLVAEL